jgi:uncharacterized protein
MKKVFIIHGFDGSPNGAWRPWLMAELEKQDIYACALSMPKPQDPIPSEWIAEIARHIDHEVYLVGHSLGATAILRYLETAPERLDLPGIILVSPPCKETQNRKIDAFLNRPFDFKIIKSKIKKCIVIHGDNDPYVPMDHAETCARELDGELIVIPNGGHLNGGAGCFELPLLRDKLLKMMEE